MRLISLLALVATASLAQEHPCKADRARLCPNVAKGPAMKQCMKAHAAEVSEVCRQAVATHHGKRAPVSP